MARRSSPLGEARVGPWHHLSVFNGPRATRLARSSSREQGGRDATSCRARPGMGRGTLLCVPRPSRCSADAEQQRQQPRRGPSGGLWRAPRRRGGCYPPSPQAPSRAGWPGPRLYPAPGRPERPPRHRCTWLGGSASRTGGGRGSWSAPFTGRHAPWGRRRSDRPRI